MRIVSNTVVHNEENFVWYALMSIALFVDQLLVWDTGSTDKTIEVGFTIYFLLFSLQASYFIYS
ncbi:hypothetical protein A3C32_04220 [Candidatus Daviesbacteria bacterium RIFCSPHIGHO2_02_FULL_41_14]|uniref:Uncharacterized protein n=1 Tax=Candidatus Daviesbacteria bacterium RIFCSPLOWO2_01_FULL_40_24 TaxID=1797787 RepID=A0A1F5MJ99_9BACT|nr:MAG: hypothetical protein A3C32_04220 [Candidatus Daviesbacteria bacterium RIFCSPHIGHO2_02_FULL_41_14]OGE65432.1 MAG: hypothetical protein A3B49_00915 [Candidatus Daviesbacteria bacterium RIFCSPLOWO2_01_FULL_40_24]